MECNPTSTRSRANTAFTLAELMISTGVSVLVVTAIGLLAFFSSRSLVAMTHYVDMDQVSQLALDKMSKEVRQARLVTVCTNTSFTIVDVNSNLVQFLYDANSRKLLRVAGATTNVYLSDCDSLTFTNYQRNVAAGSFDAYEAAYTTNTKLLQVTWVCSRTILGAKANTESVQSAKIALRNR